MKSNMSKTITYINKTRTQMIRSGRGHNEMSIKHHSRR